MGTPKLGDDIVCAYMKDKKFIGRTGIGLTNLIEHAKNMLTVYIFIYSNNDDENF